MNPHQQNKVDISVRTLLNSNTQLKIHAHSQKQSMSADEQRLFRMYGKLPNKKDLLQNKLKVSLYIPPISIHQPSLLHPTSDIARLSAII